MRRGRNVAAASDDDAGDQEGDEEEGEGRERRETIPLFTAAKQPLLSPPLPSLPFCAVNKFGICNIHTQRLRAARDTCNAESEPSLSPLFA